MLITAVVELATAWYDVASGAKEAREQAEKQAQAQQVIDDALAFGQFKGTQNSKALNDERKREFMIIDRTIRKKKLLIDQNQKENQIKKQTADLDRSAIAQKKVIVFLQQQDLKGKKADLEAEIKKNEAQVKAELNRTKSVGIYEATAGGRGSKRVGTRQVADVDPLRVASFRGKVGELEEELKALNDDLLDTNDLYDDLDLSYQEFEQRQKKGNKTTKKTGTTTRALNTELKELNRYLSSTSETTTGTTPDRTGSRIAKNGSSLRHRTSGANKTNRNNRRF